MSKEARLAFIKARFTHLDEVHAVSDAVIPASHRDVQESLAELDGFREFQRDCQSTREGLNSDEQRRSTRII